MKKKIFLIFVYIHKIYSLRNIQVIDVMVSDEICCMEFKIYIYNPVFPNLSKT